MSHLDVVAFVSLVHLHVPEVVARTGMIKEIGGSISRQKFFSSAFSLFFLQVKSRGQLVKMDNTQSNQAFPATSFCCLPCHQSFSGQYELTRHLNEAKAHKPAFHCPFPGCLMANQRPSKVKVHFFDEHSSQLVLSHHLDEMRQRITENSYPELELLDGFNSLSSAQQNLNPFEYLNVGSPHHLMPENTSFLSNRVYESCGSPHQRSQPHDLAQETPYAMSTSTFSSSSIPETSAYSNDWGAASATVLSLPSLASPSSIYTGNSGTQMAPSLAPPFLAEPHIPSALQVQPTAAVAPACLSTYPELYMQGHSIVSTEGESQVFYDETIDTIEGPEGSVNTSLDQKWVV